MIYEDVRICCKMYLTSIDEMMQIEAYQWHFAVSNSILIIDIEVSMVFFMKVVHKLLILIKSLGVNPVFMRSDKINHLHEN